MVTIGAASSMHSPFKSWNLKNDYLADQILALYHKEPRCGGSQITLKSLWLLVKRMKDKNVFNSVKVSPKHQKQ